MYSNAGLASFDTIVEAPAELPMLAKNTTDSLKTDPL